MASLYEIAKKWAEELRYGIVWLIVWKTERSWNAVAVWPDTENDCFEANDLATANKVLEQDENAVMLNTYDCGHFGENMTLIELANGIRWHYENKYNLLKNSSFFPDNYERI